MSIFNRWGQLVFETEDPEILWNGVNQTNNQKVPDGVYFYVCEVYEDRLDGLVQRNLKGTIQVFGNSSKNGN
jgi:hypothetical protein